MAPINPQRGTFTFLPNEAGMPLWYAEDEVEVASGTGLLTLVMARSKCESYEACEHINVDIRRKLDGAKRSVKIGHICATVVGKDWRSVTGKRSNPLWIEELLQQDDSGPRDCMHGTREMANMLFTEAGRPRAEFQHVANELSSSQFILIDCFMMYGKHRLKGAGRQPMSMFRTLLSMMVGPPTEVPCVLRPAPLCNVKVNNDKSYSEIEAGLIKSYEKNGFEVWFQVDPDDLDADLDDFQAAPDDFEADLDYLEEITVMGTMV